MVRTRSLKDKMSDLICGKKVALRPMLKSERDLFYTWATKSDATPFWYGELYGTRIPNRAKFFRNWKQHYFDGPASNKGRCFVIIVGGRPIGQIDYNRIDQTTKRTEIDLLIASSRDWNRGYGTDALRTFVKFLFKHMNVREVWVGAIKTNRKAIHVYKKAGFSIIETPKWINRSPYWCKKDPKKWTFLTLQKRKVRL